MASCHWAYHSLFFSLKKLLLEGASLSFLHPTDHFHTAHSILPGSRRNKNSIKNWNPQKSRSCLPVVYLGAELLTSGKTDSFELHPPSFPLPSLYCWWKWPRAQEAGGRGGENPGFEIIQSWDNQELASAPASPTAFFHAATGRCHQIRRCSMSGF